ncbi:MAG TPA: tRNA (adenine-N1)-methyltransferase [Acidimicrobiia bacterium]|nr:tRNA (adenine-N1)-methyltransferase [Acidimicrobiia bacterium]
MDPHRPFRPGERVLLVDSKARRYLITLVEGGSFSTHAGTLPHADLIGRDEGILVRTSHGSRLRAVRPTLRDYILKMPRGAQVIYPKDIGPILVLADIFPGARLLEAGVGSGALSMALLRAVGPEGAVIGYEIREDFAGRAVKNVESFLGPGQPYHVEIRDIYEGVDETGLDRIVLDLPEPWRVVKHATHALRPGGILVSYVPTIGQVARLREELDGSPFGLAETLEVLQRTWHVEGQSVRPDHRMVGHTGFLTAARLLDPDLPGALPGGPGVSPE